MATYNYAPFVAVDPSNSANVAVGATGQLFDVSDINHTTPLQPTDLNGLPLAELVSNALGIIPAFQLTVPQAVWLGAGVAVPVYSFKGVLDASQAASDAAAVAATSAASAANDATAAHAAAVEAAQAPTDASVDAGIIRAGAVAKWKANTAYALGQPVISPSGELVTAKVAHTSGSTYDSSKWNSSSAGRDAIPLNVKDYGAKGDGTTDDTAAINAALAAVPVGGRAVYLPAGRYKVSAPLAITQDGTTLCGDGTGYKVGGTSLAYGTRIEATTGISNAVVLVQRSANDRPLAGVTLRDFTIDGGLVGSGVDGIQFRCDQGVVDHVNVWRCSGNGIRLMGYNSPSWETYDSIISKCIIGENSGAGGFLDIKSSDTHWLHCVFLRNGDNFVSAVGGASLQMTGCHLYSAVNRDLYFNGSGSRSKFSNCKFEGAGQELLLIDSTNGGYSDIQFTGCGFSTLSQSSANNTYDYVRITGPSGNAVGRTQFIGCNFALKGGSTVKARYAINLETSAAQNTVIVGNSFGPASHWGTGPINNGTNSSLLTYIHGNFGVGDVIPWNVQTAAYTPTLADADCVIEMNSASALTVTIPTVATAGWTKGNSLKVTQVGAGQVTFAGASGVTLRTPRSLTTRAQWATVTLRMRATNEWVLEGDLT